MLEVYGKKDCARCSQVKSLLDKRGIEYEYTDMFGDMVDTEYYLYKVMHENKRLYPLILEDGEVVQLSEVLNKKA